MKNIKKNSDTLQVPEIGFYLVFALIVGGFGLCFVNTHNGSLYLGEKKKALEIELQEMRKEIEAARSIYAQMTNRAEIMSRLAAVGSKLVEIPEDRVVVIPSRPGYTGEGIRPVSNPSESWR